MKNDSHLFKAAREISMNADYSGGGRPRIGCIAVYKGSILAKGCNTDKTHPIQDKYNRWRFKKEEGCYLPPKKHAEIDVIQRIKYLDIDFSRVHLYIYRETRDGQKAMCRCCRACMAAIKEIGIKHIHYTTPDGFAYEIIK